MNQSKSTRPLEARRQRRIARRRQWIMDAAARVFSEKGYAQTTIREIAAQADMAEGTLYNYFSSKRDLLLAIAEESETPMQKALLEAGKLEDRQAMIAMFEAAFDVSESNLPFMRTLMAEACVDDNILHNYVAERLRRVSILLQEFIADRIAVGAFRPIDPEMGARLAMGMFAALILPVLRGVAPLPSAEERRALAKTAVDLLLDGVRVRETAEVL
ncbi:MAG: TetR/AcrR family transcriptional regulator [Anaerolineae bacterium]